MPASAGCLLEDANWQLLCHAKPSHNQITWNNFKQPVPSVVLRDMVYGWDKDNRSVISLPRNLPMEGPFVPCIQDVVQYDSSAYRADCVRQKGLMEFFAPSVFCSSRSPPAPSLHSPALQAPYPSCAPRPGCAPRLWRSWRSTCNSASAPLPWLWQPSGSWSEFCLQNL